MQNVVESWNVAVHSMYGCVAEQVGGDSEGDECDPPDVDINF